MEFFGSAGVIFVGVGVIFLGLLVVSLLYFFGARTFSDAECPEKLNIEKTFKINIETRVKNTFLKEKKYYNQRESSHFW